MNHPTHFVIPFDLWMDIAVKGNDPWPIRAKKLKALVEANGFDFSAESITKRIKTRFPLHTDIREAHKAEGYRLFAGDLRAMKPRIPKLDDIDNQLKMEL